MEWRTLPWNDRYEVSETGVVRSKRMQITERNTGKTYWRNGKVLSQYKNQKGYFCVQLGHESLPVHRIVGLTFVDNPNNYPQIDHIDCNKENNHYTNLEWVTVEENLRRAYANGLRNMEGLEAYRKSRQRPVHQILNGEIVATYPSFQDAALATPPVKERVRASNIRRSCELGYRAYGFHWQYA